MEQECNVASSDGVGAELRLQNEGRGLLLGERSVLEVGSVWGGAGESG